MKLVELSQMHRNSVSSSRAGNRNWPHVVHKVQSRHTVGVREELKEILNRKFLYIKAYTGDVPCSKWGQ
jgi:hypothetical protein